MTSKRKDIQSYITKMLSGAALLFGLICYLLLVQLPISKLYVAIAMLFIVIICCWFIVRFKRRLNSAFKRALLHLEAVKMEDYNQFSKSDFSEGCAAEFHQSLKELSEHLLKNKSRYDQHAFLLYQLIDQLNTPMMVFNQKYKLTYANAAFTALYGQPWQMYRLASPKLLGLEKTEKGWEFPRTGKRWQISESEFIDAGEAHYLLVLTNIDSAVRESQVHAWRQIIRVMGHEIRNSLTPVSSLAESLASKLDIEREKEALELISERCNHLQDFVNRYASLSQKLNLSLAAVNLEPVFNRIKTLLPDLDIQTMLIESEWRVDQAFFEQVLINLVKNAKEADASQVVVKTRRKNDFLHMTLTDNGHGFANADNLFVPLFSTKASGQGIGLVFCRNVIEQHGGSIVLVNNEDKGVCVTIRMPVNPSEQLS